MTTTPACVDLFFDPSCPFAWEVGLPAELADTADGTTYDHILHANQNNAMARVGTAVGTPVVHLDGTGIFGPIMTSVPCGVDAAQVFDAVRLLADIPYFFELKRTVTGEFNFA